MKLKKKFNHSLFQLSLVAIFFGSCNSPYKENILNGCWYSFNNDTLYQELCFTDSTCLFFYEEIEFFGPFKYAIDNDTLVLFYYKEGNWFERDYRPRLVYINANDFLLEYKNELNLYSRINTNHTSLNDINSDSLYYKYLHEFYKRKMKYLFKAGYDVDTAVFEFRIEEFTLPLDSAAMLVF